MIKQGIRLVLATIMMLLLSGCYAWQDERNFREACYLNGGTPEFARTSWGITYSMQCQYDR
jgi:hypothetical protein